MPNNYGRCPELGDALELTFAQVAAGSAVVAGGLLAAWWRSLKASNDRDWRADVRRACENGTPEFTVNREMLPVIREFQRKSASYLRDRLRKVVDKARDADLSGELDPAHARRRRQHRKRGRKTEN